MFIFIPPITTISPSLTNNFVSISLLVIPGSSEPATSTGVSLLTKISNNTFPSPIILGVAVKDKAASLNCVDVDPSVVTV